MRVWQGLCIAPVISFGDNPAAIQPKCHMTTNRDGQAVKPLPDKSTDLRQLTATAVAISSATLAACGGGGGNTQTVNVDKGGGDPVAVTPQVASLLPEDAAARFLAQAGLSATPAAVGDLVASKLDFKAWLSKQFDMPIGMPLFDIARSVGFAAPANIALDVGLDNTLWFRLFTAPDELRQRVVLALSEIFVVSARNMPVPWGHFSCLAYWDLLEQHCFGTFRDLIEAITLSPAMGVYLSMRGSQKGDTVTGRRPDENYARELLQLFTIGLLNLDDAGQPIVRNGLRETYTNDDVTQLARALTGWDFDGVATYDSSTKPDYTRKPMIPNEDWHDTDAKTVLGQPMAVGQDARTDLKQALDIICSHPNVAPFVAKQLIQRFVSSNPEPDHVRRVAAVFNDNGKGKDGKPGQRGDMKAVITAVLTDPLARDPLTGDQAVRRCKLREPLLRFIQWGRLVGLRSTLTPADVQSGTAPQDLWNIGDLSAASRLAQSPLRSPSVFNFFRPGYVPLHSGVKADGFVAPEFQITDESSVIGYANFMLSHIAGSPKQYIVVDYSPWLSLASEPDKLVDNINLLLTGRALSQVTVDAIVKAIKSLPAQGEQALLNRAMMAFYLMLVSPDYMVQR
jgi:uncharacterized protein (DUF1800 family)